MLRSISYRTVLVKNFSPIWVSSCKRSHETTSAVNHSNKEPEKCESKRVAEFRKKLRETTPIEDLGEQPAVHPSQKNDPFQPFPNNTNPRTGEIDGPRGPEPTRYGDWEKKGRCSDF